MSLQFISDSTGKTTAMYIPGKEFNKPKIKVKGIDQKETDVPEWHKEIVRQRLNEFKNAQDLAIDFDDAMDDIERVL